MDFDPERVSVGFCDSKHEADSMQVGTLFPFTDSTQTRSMRPSRSPSISSNVHSPSPINSTRIVSNAQSSFPEPSPECPDPTETLDNETGAKLRGEYLIGKTIKGILMRRRGGFFIKWNDELTDAVFVSEECVSRDIGDKKQKGLVALVKCTIEKLGPGYADWKKQHPSSSKIELVRRYWNSWHRRQSEKSQRGNTLSMVSKSQRGIRRPPPRAPLKTRSLSARGIRMRSRAEANRRNASGKLIWRPRCLSENAEAETRVSMEG